MNVVASRPHYAAHLAPVASLVEDVDGVLVASYRDLVEARRRRRDRRIVLMQHGAGQSYSDRHPHYPGGDDNDDVGLFLTPGESAADRWRVRYPGTPAIAVGSPRVERLPRREAGPVTVAIAFHWDAWHHPEARSAFAHFRPALPALRDAFALIGTGHPRARHLPGVYASLGVEFVPDFEDVCRRADLLVADNTSALFEFAATGRPVVVLNAPWYRRTIRHGLRFWDASGVGINVDDPDELVATVRRALEGDRTALREAALAQVYAVRTGSALRAAQAIREWAA